MKNLKHRLIRMAILDATTSARQIFELEPENRVFFGELVATIIGVLLLLAVVIGGMALAWLV